MAYDFSESTMRYVLEQSNEFERTRFMLCSKEIGELLRTKYDMDAFSTGAALLMAGMEFLKLEHDRQHGAHD